MKPYTVNVAFEVEGLAYAVGQTYELSPEVVATLAEGVVTEYVVPVAASEEAATPSTEVASEATPATPWVGTHVVGRDN